MTTLRIRRRAGTAALALALAGCGGATDRPESPGGGAATGARRVDACELVRKSEVEAIVGAPVANADGDFSEHTYTKPTSYTASCMYLGAQMVMLGVNYPTASRPASAAELAAQVTRQLRSQVGSDPSTDELYRSTEVQPVEGLAAPAAAYELAGQTTLEVRPDGYTVKVIAPSLDHARQVAEKVLERLAAPS